MIILRSVYRIRALLLVSGLLFSCLHPGQGLAAGYGSLAGVVSDNKGVPLMGATVMVVGPMAFATEVTSQTVEHMVTDARGRFTVVHLIPGWYSLKVSSPTRLPAMRNGIRVEAGETVVATFVLTDTFAPIRFQVPSNSVSSWSDEWKWVLRTSSTTRPILRFHSMPPARQDASRDEKSLRLQDERFAGILPGPSPRDPLAEDSGNASMFAYLQSRSADSDLLVAGSLAPLGTGTVGTVLRRNQLQSQPQEFGLAFHQLSLVPGASIFPGTTPNGMAAAKGLTATYSETRLVAPRVTVTAGMDINYLSSIDSVFAAQPRVSLEYQATTQTVVSAQLGSGPADGSHTMLDRLGALSAFPQIVQHNGHLEMERLNHTELAVNHRIGKSGRVQAAAYHDGMHNAAVWGLGSATYGQAFMGNFLANPAGGGLVISGGNYQSVGFRAIYAKTFGSHVEVLGAYASGKALSVSGYTYNGPAVRNSQGQWVPVQTNTLTGKLTAELPGTHTRISTSYQWVPNDRVTMVDPAGQAALQTQPYLGIQVRQPIPTPSFLPVHIDAVADFQNLLSQGYTFSGQGGQKPLVLSSGYHAVRGGFSVQF